MLFISRGYVWIYGYVMDIHDFSMCPSFQMSLLPLVSTLNVEPPSRPLPTEGIMYAGAQLTVLAADEVFTYLSINV